MANSNTAKAVQVVARVVQLCEFVEHQAVRSAVQQHVPVSMPQSIGSLGFDAQLWAGFGAVGLWAALDAFAERAGIPEATCPICKRRCIPQRFSGHVHGNEGQALQELEDLRHLYAHNYAGQLDDAYAKRRRHVLVRGAPAALTSGGRFDGQSIQIDLPHLKYYAEVVRTVLERVP